MSASLLTRTAHRGKAAVERLKGMSFTLGQTSVASGLAWYLAHDLLAHPQPFFAPIAAAVRQARVWGKRQAALERAVQRAKPPAVASLLSRLARVDALAKGIGQGSVWDELIDMALDLAGRPLRLSDPARL